MKTLATGLVAVVLATSVSAFGNDREVVEQAIHDFADGASERDESTLRRALHAQSRQFVPSERGVTELDLDTYVKLVTSGKIGGEPLGVTIHDVRIDGVSASADASFDGATMRLRHHLSLVRGADGWQIITSVVRVVPLEDAGP